MASSKISKKKNTKKTSSSSSSSTFKFFVLFFTLSVVGLLYYDIKQEGSWQLSRTRKALVDSGACEFVHQALNATKQGLNFVDGHVEQMLPGYRQTVSEFWQPYGELFHDVGIVLGNVFRNAKEVIVSKYPVVVQTVESYAPGLIEGSQKALCTAWTASVYYFNSSVDYLKKEVFVGQLSPENMQRVVIEALNTTQNKATEYYHWIYEKVQTTIK